MILALGPSSVSHVLTLNLLMTTIVAPPSNASKWQMGFNSAFKELIVKYCLTTYILDWLINQVCQHYVGHCAPYDI
jgi:hypothetical protein